MLGTYAASGLMTVEAHSTHRRRPPEATLVKWVAGVPDGFRFAPKAHVGITHRRDTDGLPERVAEFFGLLAPLGDRLGPVLHVLPHRQPDLARLDLLIEGLGPHAGQAVFELAPPWRTDAVLARLERAGVSLAVVDREDDPGEGQPVVGPVRYVRLRRDAYAEADLDRWAGALTAAEAGGQDVYAYVRHDEDGSAPRYALGLVERVGHR